MSSPRRLGSRARGFTLVELLVTVALLAVVLALAAPNFQAYKRNSELTSVANSFVSLLAVARSEAMKRGRVTLVVPSDQTNWANGWTAFVDENFNNVYDAGVDALIATRDEALPPYLSMTQVPSPDRVKYNGSGYNNFVPTTLQIARNDVTGAELLPQTRRIKLSSTGRTRVCTPKSPTDLTCEATAGL